VKALSRCIILVQLYKYDTDFVRASDSFTQKHIELKNKWKGESYSNKVDTEFKDHLSDFFEKR
jgi:hypothetical protein